jgi:hypothetical protein
MGALFKYLVGVAVILPLVMGVFSAVILGANFVGFTTVAHAPATTTSRLNADPIAGSNTRYIAHGSLSPIYPATPGKELLEKPIYTAKLAKKHKELGSAKRIDVRQALKLYKVPRQIYSADLDDRNYPQQSLSYTETPRSQPLQPRMSIIFGHGIY